jgi:hypothetical protein
LGATLACSAASAARAAACSALASACQVWMKRGVFEFAIG